MPLLTCTSFLVMLENPFGKKNGFGWYVMGRFPSQENQTSRIHSNEVGTINAVEDMKKLLTQDMLEVKSPELCACSDNDLKEKKFVKSITKSTQIIDGRLQVVGSRYELCWRTKLFKRNIARLGHS